MDSVRNRDCWVTLLQNIRDRVCVPFLGAGACLPVLPTGGELAEELFRRSKVKGPYPFDPSTNLAKVAQYVAALKNDAPATKRHVEEILKERIAKSADPIPPLYRLLARLKLPVYITTNYDLLLEAALKEIPGVDPVTEICRWSPDLLDTRTSRFDTGEYRPKPESPVVFHLHGAIGADASSFVLTEDDYLDFLLNVSRELSTSPSTKGQAVALPLPLRSALRKQPLLFIGYSLTDVNFLFILRALTSTLEAHQRVQRVAVQLSPKSLPDGDDIASYFERVEKYFAWTYTGVSVLWLDAANLSGRLETELFPRPPDAPAHAPV